MTIKLANANLRVLESAILVLWQYRFYHFNMYYQMYYLFKLIYLCLVPMFSVIAWWTKITFFTSIFIILYLQSNIYYISYIKFLSIFLSYGESLNEKLLMKLNCRIQNQFSFFLRKFKNNIIIRPAF